MQTSPVVKYLDVFKRHGYPLVPCFEAFTVHSFVFEATEPAFGRGVIPAVALAAHGTNHAVHLQLGLKYEAGILAALIRMMYQPSRRFATEPRHSQRIGHNVRRHARLQ